MRSGDTDWLGYAELGLTKGQGFEIVDIRYSRQFWDSLTIGSCSSEIQTSLEIWVLLRVTMLDEGSHKMKLLEIFFSSLLLSSPLLAQQVKFIDLTTAEQRVTLRYPSALPGQMGESGGGSIGDCGVDARQSRSLTVSLQSVTPRQFDPQRPMKAEFKILNTGRVLLELPVSPNLADLQPTDASETFSYASLALSVTPIEDRGAIGFVELYGRENVAGTMIMLKPGEWIQVEANVKFIVKPLHSGLLHVEGGYWLRRTTFHPAPGGYSTSAEGICLKSDPTAPIPIRNN